MKPELRKLLDEGRLKMTNPTGQSAADHKDTDRPCFDCGTPIPYYYHPCANCGQYCCEKCSDPIEGICLACPNRAREQQESEEPVTYKVLARMVAESEERIRYDQMMKRRAFEERVQLQYRKELDQIRTQVAELFKDLTPAA